MSPEEVRSKILLLLHKVAPEANLALLDPTENLREALDIDSFDFLKVVVALHDTFGVTVPESDYARITTLKGMTEYVTGTSSTYR